MVAVVAVVAAVVVVVAVFTAIHGERLNHSAGRTATRLSPRGAAAPAEYGPVDRGLGDSLQLCSSEGMAFIGGAAQPRLR